ncbi:MAG TPA: ATP-binding SpoIIE family protein phosphatase [Vicinamibacterales bacterium]|nr:ATP-binding SpoIIE family protein phosphatase [Vicinamibacterales bacterium]
MNAAAAHAVHDSSEVASARRAVLDLVGRLGFSEERAGQAALIVTELGTNLAKHARSGEMVLRTIQANGGAAPEGIEILAIDRGPGMPDVPRAREDGYSTAGTLGHGLGSIERQSDFFQIYSQPSGTVAVAQLWSERRPLAARQPLYQIGAVLVSHPGEMICGDAWGWAMRDDRFAIMVADGLGHGLLAHEAADAAIAIFYRNHEASPSRLIADVHAALRPTRGAAVATVAVDTDRGVATFCGVGNIGAALVSGDGSRHGMVSQNGTAGHMASRIHEFSYPLPSRPMIVMYSDGLGSQWDLAAYPGVSTRHPSVIAGILYRDFSRRRDDVTVVVAKPR